MHTDMCIKNHIYTYVYVCVRACTHIDTCVDKHLRRHSAVRKDAKQSSYSKHKAGGTHLTEEGKQCGGGG